jgi:hypothetical protein
MQELATIRFFPATVILTKRSSSAKPKTPEEGSMHLASVTEEPRSGGI